MDYQNLMSMNNEELLTAAFLAAQDVNFVPMIPHYKRILPIETWTVQKPGERKERYGMFIYHVSENTGILCWSSGYSRDFGSVGNLVLKSGETSEKFSPVGHLHGKIDELHEQHLVEEVIQTCKIFRITTLYKYGGYFGGEKLYKNPAQLMVKGDYGDLKGLCNTEYKITYPERRMVPYICCEC
jgi:hypothetical protein